MSAIKGVSLTPSANGLNAAAAAGVDIAHQVMAKSAQMNQAGVYVKIGAEANANPNGLMASGMLNDDDEEDKEKKKQAKEEKAKK